MNVAVAMTVLAGVALLWIWAPASPRQERHEHLRALDALRDADWWPYGRCGCGAALDERGVCTDGASCTRDRWEQDR